MSNLDTIIGKLEDVTVIESLRSESEQAILDAVAFLQGLYPRMVTREDFNDYNALDDYGYLPVWQENRYTGEVECQSIHETILHPKWLDHHRYWTAKPTLELMQETPWEYPKKAEGKIGRSRQAEEETT